MLLFKIADTLQGTPNQHSVIKVTNKLLHQYCGDHRLCRKINYKSSEIHIIQKPVRIWCLFMMLFVMHPNGDDHTFNYALKAIDKDTIVLFQSFVQYKDERISFRHVKKQI
eukprot:23973_1